MNVATLTRALLQSFPASDAEPWDHVGLSVGDPSLAVERVAVALDATAEVVDEAVRAGAQVLLAHHPVYIKAPDTFVPQPGDQPQAAAAVYRAAKHDLGIISLHTNLDRSHTARKRMASLLGLAIAGSFEHPQDPVAPGLGLIACPQEPQPLARWAQRAASAFSTDPRVWGDPEHEISRVAVLGGSLSDLGELALAAGADLIICGEAGYHVCQDLKARGCAVILLGHDASEYPFVDILMDASITAGIAPEHIVTMSRSRQWWTAREGNPA